MNNTKSISLHKFITTQILISYGAVNVIINMLIFYFMHWNERTHLISSNAFLVDLITTTFLLSFTVGLFAYSGVKKELKKGVSIPINYTKKDHLIIKLLPSNSIIAAIMVAFFSSLFIPVLFAGIGTTINLFPLTFVNGMILKGLACGAAGSFTGYFMVLLALLNHN